MLQAEGALHTIKGVAYSLKASPYSIEKMQEWQLQLSSSVDLTLQDKGQRVLADTSHERVVETAQKQVASTNLS